MRQRQYLKIFFLAIVCASLLLIGSWLPLTGQVFNGPTASAHSFVIGSDPIDGSTVSRLPSIVRIYFDAPIAPASQASVYAFPPGTTTTGVLVNVGPSRINAANPRELDAALLPPDKLPQGGYEVRWTALSLTDGQTTSGLIGFNLGQSSTGADGVPLLGPSTSNHFPQLSLQGILAIGWDWLVLLALCFWVGIFVAEYFIVPRSASAVFLAQVRTHSRSLQALCLVALLAGEVINLVLRTTTFTATLTGNTFSADELYQLALHTHYGWLWLMRVSLLAVALLWLGWQIYRQRRAQGNSSGPAIYASPARRASRHFRQLRQQAHQEVTQAMSAKVAPTPLPARRVTDAMTVSAPTRGTTAALPKITKPIEVPAHTPSLG
ncbi:MAG: copper resistance CopC family protein, partial [Ktedonobacteraceae bacterium]